MLAAEKQQPIELDNDDKGDKVTVKGEVVDLWCYLEGRDRGADHKTCAIACAKAGNPIGLVTEKDEV